MRQLGGDCASVGQNLFEDSNLGRYVQNEVALELNFNLTTYWWDPMRYHGLECRFFKA